MLKREKLTGKSKFIWVILGFLLMLPLAGSCSKEDSKENVVIPDIALNKSELTLEKGKTERLIASFTPAETPDKGHVWASSIPGVATVDETGMVTAVIPGEAVITVTALTGKKTATCKVTVVDKVVRVTGVSIKPTESTMVVGDDLILEAVVTPENATNKAVTWSSGDSKIASVDATGKVTAIAEGKVTIEATTNDGDKTASCQITIVNRGVEISKPEVSDITSVSALVEGVIKASGVKVTEAGICYSTSQSPTVNDKKVVLSGEDISYTLTKLEANTTYYVRIYAVVDGAAKYGDQAMFTTAVTVEISVPQISSISSSSAQISGTITTYGLQMDEVGICYSTSSMPTVDATKVALSGNGIVYTLNELTPETAYYVRIYAKLDGEYYYGDQGMFTTSGIIKTHFEPTDIYEDKAVLTSVAPSGVKKVDICYGTSPNPKITDNVTTASVGSDGKLRLSLTDLIKGTTYYLRAYSRVGSKIEYYDDEVSVQTVGKEFSVVREASFRSEKSDVEYTPSYRQWYRLYLTYTYDIKVKGTYLVEAIGGGAFKKTGDFSASIYLENGTGSFTFMRDKALFENSWPYASYYFNTATDVRITNLETNVCYHIMIERVTFKSA